MLSGGVTAYCQSSSGENWTKMFLKTPNAILSTTDLIK
jgi:hypothetical protein